MKKIRIFLVNLAKKNKTLRIFFRNILNLKNKLKYSYYKTKYKMDDKTILFEAFGGRNYTCSPKAIYEKMLTMKEFKDYTFVWSFIDPSKHEVKKDKRLKIIKSKSKEYYKYISISKYWIVNSIIEEGITKKKDQVYVQCWHGTPLKRLRYDIVVNGASLNSVEEITKILNNYDLYQNKYLGSKTNELETMQMVIISKHDLFNAKIEEVNQSPQLQYLIYLLKNETTSKE